MSLFGPHIIDLSRPGAADLLRLAGPALGGMLAVNTTDSLDLAAANGVPLRIFRDMWEVSLL